LAGVETVERKEVKIEVKERSWLEVLLLSLPLSNLLVIALFF
jgi:hypothetical protein